MKITNLPISSITPYERNTKKHDATQIANVAESIKQYGFVQPIVIDKENVVVIGHCRLLAAKKLGMKEVPCVCVDDLTEEQVKALRLIDNKTNESEWDFDFLTQELDGLDLDGFDIDWELPQILDATEVVEDDFEEELPKEPKAKRGDIYQVGRHRLMCGDSTDENDIRKLMANNKADMVLSDPPYGMFLDTDFSTIKGSMNALGRKNNTTGNKYNKVIGDNDDFKPELITTFFDNFSYCKEMFLFGADYFAELLPNKNDGSWLVWDKRKPSQADAIGSEFELCWSKEKHKRRMLRHDWFGFLSSENSADARNRVHPTQKPITLLADIMNQWGEPKDKVVDLYGGSGSTLMACEQNERDCFMMELDPHYIDVIIDRWEQYTGQKAVLLND